MERDVWNHAVLTWENGTRKLYMNGVLGVEGATFAKASNGKLYIGRNTYLVDAPFVGALDDLQVYDRALTADKVQWLYNNPGLTYQVN